MSRTRTTLAAVGAAAALAVPAAFAAPGAGAAGTHHARAAQQPGQSLTVDLGREQTVRRVVLDTGADQGDFPRGYALATSRDGTSWHEAATGTGSGQLTSIDVRPTRARWLRITQTGSAPQWWSVADLRIYG